MQRNRYGSYKLSSRRSSTTRTKGNPLSDIAYLTQNENDVIKMKNNELNSKIYELKRDLSLQMQRIGIQEQEVYSLRKTFKETEFREDGELEIQKKGIVDKIVLIGANKDILKRKIQEAREATVFEQGKMVEIEADRNDLEKNILLMKAQNEGTKMVLRSLEEENYRLRKENSQLVSRRRHFEPYYSKVANYIEYRISQIKDRRQEINHMRKNETKKLFEIVFVVISIRRLKEALMFIERYSLVNKTAKKLLFRLTIIRKKYLCFQKNKVLQSFKGYFRPLKEQGQAEKIISYMRVRRTKNRIWRMWRSEALNKEYFLMKAFSLYNMLYKLLFAFSKTNMYSCFNELKYFRNSSVKTKGCYVINRIHKVARVQTLNSFLSSLKAAYEKYKLDLEVEACAKEESILLVLGMYFGAWAVLTKNRHTYTRCLKFRCFRELKKLIANKKRRMLSGMLVIAQEKISQMNTVSLCFSAMSKYSVDNRIYTLEEKVYETSAKVCNIKEEIEEFQTYKKHLYGKMALLRICNYLRINTQKAFSIWRKATLQRNMLKNLQIVLGNKRYRDQYQAFTCLNNRAFTIFRQEIKAKIEDCETRKDYLYYYNDHMYRIMQVKTNELQIIKFKEILSRLARQEHYVKLKYFYRLMKNSTKYNICLRMLQRANKIIENKIKSVFIYKLYSFVSYVRRQDKITAISMRYNAKLERKGLIIVFQGLLNHRNCNRRMKKALRSVFYRDLELLYYGAFGRIKRYLVKVNYADIVHELASTSAYIKRIYDLIATDEQAVEMMRTRLECKEYGFRRRKMIAFYRVIGQIGYDSLRMFMKRWHYNVSREIRIYDFTQALYRKTKIYLKKKFIIAFQAHWRLIQIYVLQRKANKYRELAKESDNDFYREVAIITYKCEEMRKENHENSAKGKIFYVKSNHMVEIMLRTFARYKNKNMCGRLFTYWQKHTYLFKNAWKKVYRMINIVIKRNGFYTMYWEVKQSIHMSQMKHYLSLVLTNNFIANMKIAFTCWKMSSLRATLHIRQSAYAIKTKQLAQLEKHSVKLAEKNKLYLEKKRNDILLRKVLGALSSYTCRKKCNNYKKIALEKWLITGYAAEIVGVMRAMNNRERKRKEVRKNFKVEKINRIYKAFFNEILHLKQQKDIIKRLFVERFIFHRLQILNEYFFSRIKGYISEKYHSVRTKAAWRIYKLINCFEKRRIILLGNIMCRWRRNKLLKSIQLTLLKRLTRRAINNKVRYIFYIWRLYKYARLVLETHTKEGYIKQKRIEKARLAKYLQEYKTKNGVLLPNYYGQLVLSPRMHQYSEKYERYQNTLRYKFISRLILSMNGLSAAVRSWRNLSLYAELRQKLKQIAARIVNNRRQPGLYESFATWRGKTREFKQMLYNLPRKELMKIVIGQKYLVEVYSTKKDRLEAIMHKYISNNQILSRQASYEEKFAVQVLIRNARKVITHAFALWLQRVEECKEEEVYALQAAGNAKIEVLSSYIRELYNEEEELRETNRRLIEAVKEAAYIADLVKQISYYRDQLSHLTNYKQLTCYSLQYYNQYLQYRLHLAQQYSLKLFMLSEQEFSDEHSF